MPERTAQGVPKRGIKERFFDGHHKGGIVIGARPCRVFVIRPGIGGYHAVRAVDMIAPLGGFVYGFFDSHLGAPCPSYEERCSHFETQG